MSGNSETTQMKSKTRSKRMMPSTRLNMIWPLKAGFHFFNSLVVNSGTSLYMAMKKGREMTTFTAASHPLMVAAFSRDFVWAESVVAAFVEGSASLRFTGTAEAAVSTCFVLLASLPITSSIATLAEKRRGAEPGYMAKRTGIHPRTMGQGSH